MTDFEEILHLQGKRISTIDTRREDLKSQLEEALSKREESKKNQALMEKVEALFKKILDKCLTDSFVMIEELVTEGLSTVYGNRRLRFKITPIEKRGIYQVEISTLDIEKNVEGPTEDLFGGMVVQIEEFLLRLIFAVQTKMVPFMVMDESFNCVSSEYLQNLASLLREMCSKFNMDLLLVTHQQEMRENADDVFEAVDNLDGKGLVLK